MTDLRQGVTATQHTALDMIDDRGAAWSAAHDYQDQLRMGAARAGNAYRAAKLTAKRDFAVEAAARLLDAADRMTALIEAQG